MEDGGKTSPGVEEWMLEPTIYELEREEARRILDTGVQDPILPLYRVLGERIEDRYGKRIRSTLLQRKLDEAFVRGDVKWRKSYVYSWLVACPECDVGPRVPCAKSMPRPHRARRVAARKYSIGVIERYEQDRMERMRLDDEEVEYLEGITPPRLDISPLFDDRRVDDLFSHLDLRWWDELPYEARMERYWSCPHEAARRRRAQLVKEYEEGKRCRPPPQHNSRGPQARSKQAPPPFLVMERTRYRIDSTPLLSRDGCFHHRPSWCSYRDDDRVFTGFYYRNRTWRAGMDRRWG